ncbi:hypothetical protein VUR80DRAFT_8927 [Thermomyces stellatus]
MRPPEGIRRRNDGEPCLQAHWIMPMTHKDPASASSKKSLLDMKEGALWEIACRGTWKQCPMQIDSRAGLPRRDPGSAPGWRGGTAFVALLEGADHRPDVLICVSVQRTRTPGDQIAH